MTRLLRYALLLSLLTLSSVAVFAQNFPIIGSASLYDAYEEDTNARGADFYFASNFGDAPDGFAFCYSGQVCDGTLLTSAESIPVVTNSVPIADSRGCLGDVCTPGGYGHGMSGTINVTYKFSFLTPTADQDISFAVPITVTGSVNAIGSGGQTLWTVNIAGKGTARLSGTLAGGVLKFEAITFKYAGTGTVAAK